MKKQTKLAFDRLEEEMEVLSSKEMKELLGGTGVVTSGSGTKNDPYVVTEKLYYGDDLSAASVDALNNAAGHYNSIGNFKRGGEYYKFNVSTHHSSNPSASANSEDNRYGPNGQYGIGVAVTSKNLGGSVFGDEGGGSSIRIDQSKVDTAYNAGFNAAIGASTGGHGDFTPSISKNSFLTHVFDHEIGHSFGADDGEAPTMRGFTGVYVSSGQISTGNSSGGHWMLSTPGNVNKSFGKKLIDDNEDMDGQGSSGSGGIYNPFE